ncbi:MAG: inverse autotransporter beta domain-containing protein [Planctomycetales bacterium]|nr:inverse autotransporter beta domain-containing protein [Planctomycetales bacterium]
MQIVQNPNRWLKKLSRAAALVGLMTSCGSALSQDSELPFGRTPSGSASEVKDYNRDGFGVQFRGGHTAGDTVGRKESISHINLTPYFNVEDELFFGDSRLVRANGGELAWAFGGGYRHYISDWDVVVGANSYFDADQLTGAHLKQWGVGAELLANTWEARGNFYQPFDSDPTLTNQRVDPGSVAFSGDNITYSRIDTFAEALKGFDAEAGFLLPGALSERFDLRAFGGGYHYEGTNIAGFSGWSSRLQADIGGWLELGLKVTDDQLFDTTVSFNAVVHLGGFSSQEHTKRSAIQRFRDPVRRNLNILASISDVTASGQVALNPGGLTPVTVAHVNSNATGPVFNGSVTNPYELLTQGLGAGTDLVYVWADSVFNTAPQNVVNLLPGQEVVGEGNIQPGRDTNSSILVDLLGTPTLISLPKSPLFAANPTYLRPTLSNTTGNTVTMAQDTQFSGFIIDGPTGSGIFSNGMGDMVINDVLVQDAGASGISLLNPVGVTAITNTTLVSGAAATGPLFHVNGGSGIVSFGSTDRAANGSTNIFGLASLSNTSAQPTVMLENMTGGRVDMTNSNNTSTGGGGILIQNNTGGVATIDNVSVTGSTGNGIAIIDSAGVYTFNKTSGQLGQITIDNAALQSVLIDNASGQVNFTDKLLITNRNAEGIEALNSSGIAIFSNAVTINGLGAGAGAEAALSVHDQLSGSFVTFRDTVGVAPGVGGRGSLGNGINIRNNAAGGGINIEGTTSIVATDLASIAVDANASLVRFQGSTLISQRLQQGILVTNSPGAVQFGSTLTDLTSIQNDDVLPSQFAAMSFTGNSGAMSVQNTFIVNAQGGAPGGAGIHVVNNTGAVSFGAINVESFDGIGLFGLNNTSIRVGSGVIVTDAAAAVDIEQTGINIALGSVTSTNSPNFGIRLVETNKTLADGSLFKTFKVDPNIANAVPGDGGQIINAKGDGLDNNDSAGVFLQNAGQVRLRAMQLEDNEFGIRIRNTETTPGLANNVKQNFVLVTSTILDSDIRGLDSQDLMGLDIQNSTFDNNGDDAAVGRESMLLNYTVRLDLDTITRFDQAKDPFVVLIQDTDFSSNTTDVINITQSNAAAGAAIQTELLRNTFTVTDTSNPTGTDPFDDAFTFNWNGPVRARIEGNKFDMIAPTQAQAINYRTRSTTDHVELSIQNNIFNVNNVTQNVGAVDVRIDGPALMNTFAYRTANNLWNVGNGGANGVVAGGRPTALRYQLAANTGVTLFSNDFLISGDGGTGIQFVRAAASSSFQIDGNRIGLADFGTAPERGIIFSQVTGVVELFGNINNVVRITQTQVPGNGVVEQEFFMPINSNNGQIIVNGAFVP